MNNLNIFYIGGFLLFWLMVTGCKTTEGLPENVIQSVENRIENGTNPSIAIAVIDNKEISYYNFGKTSADGKLIDEQSIYEIGSISKVFTAILLAQEVVNGIISLDDPIDPQLPEHLEIPIKGQQKITFGHLSDHTSGLPRMPTNFAPANFQNPYADYSVEQMYSFLSSYTPVREVGSEYEYSNLAQGLLGHILGLMNDQSYEELMIETIASPLGMEETRISLSQKMKDNLAVGHSNGEEVENWDIPTLAGAGAIRSSTSDLVKFLSANLGYTETDLDPAMNLTHKIRHNKAGNVRVGLAWHIKEGKHGDVFFHNGGTGGYNAFAGFVKESGKGVVVLSNSTESIEDIGFHLLDPDSPLREIRTNPEVVQVSEEILKSYVGNYELNPTFIIAITQQGEKLFLQATGQNKFELFAESTNEFFLTAVDAQIQFNADENRVESLTLFQNGREMMCKKME